MHSRHHLFRAVNDFFRYTTEELLSLTVKYTISKEAASQGIVKDVMGGKKRWKRRPQWAVATTGRDDDNNTKQADNSNMEHIMTVGRSVKRHARPPTDHFKRLLEEACPNHVYPIKHKLRDYGMMKNFMVSGSLTWDMEPKEDLGGRDVMPFPREDVVMTVYDGCLLQRGVACPT
jgi:hypothetical protein